LDTANMQILRAITFAALSSLIRAEFSSSCEDHNSLLQATITQHTPPAQHVTEANLVLTSVTSLAKSLTQSSSITKTPDEVQAAISQATAVLDSMVPILSEEHSLAQRQVDRQFDEIEACRNHATRGVLSTTQNSEEVDAQRATVGRCNDLNDDAQLAQSNAQVAWDNLVSLLVDSQPGRLTATNLYNGFMTWKEWIETNDATVETHLADLNAATLNAETQAGECASATEVYNAAFCQHRLSCAMLGACQAHEAQVYHEMRDEINEGMESRQAQSATIEQVHCLLQLINAAVETNNTLSENELDACQLTSSNNADLVITFPSVPHALECPAVVSGDPECPGLADVNEIDEWSGGEAAAGGAEAAFGPSALTFEFCSGPRTGSQFTVSLPLEGVLSEIEIQGNEAICYPNMEESDGWIWQQKRVYFMATDGINIDFLGMAYDDCVHPMTGFALYNLDNGCGSEFSDYSTGVYNTQDNSYPELRGVATWMTAKGARGWEIFHTMEDTERYSVVSGGMLPLE